MKLRRILTGILCASLHLNCTVSLTGCRKRTVEKTTVDYAYRVTTLEKPEDMNYPRSFFRAGERIYMSYNVYDDETGERQQKIYSMALDGTDLREDSLPAMLDEVSENETTSISTQHFLPAEDGTFYKCVNQYTYDWETGYSEELTFLKRLQADGTEIFSVNAEEYWGKPDPNPENRVYHYMQNLKPYDGGVLFQDDQTLYAADSEGKLVGKAELTDLLDSENVWVQNIFTSGKEILLLCADYSGMMQKFSVLPLDIRTGKAGEPTELDATAFRNVYNIFEGEGYLFYYSDDEMLYGYDYASNTSVPLMNFINSDVTSNAVNNVLVIDPDTFITNGYDEVSGGHAMMLMQRIPPEQQQPRYILTIATLDDMWSIQSDVIRFNRQSTEYRMQIRNYSPMDYYEDSPTGEYNYEELRSQALSALNTDIVTGNMPDILVINESMSIESYIAKGLFVDLYERIDQDERFSREDFLSNILDAYSVNGKLYELAPKFSVQTLVGKESMVGGRKGWTMAEFTEWAETIPEEAVVFFELTRDDLLDMFCMYAYEEFVDPDTGRCSFDSEDFKLILSYANSLSTESIYEKMDSDGYDEEFWMNYENRFRDDRAMLEVTYLSRFNVLVNLMNNTFFTPDPLSVVGLPSKDRSGSAIYATPTYAISSQSLLIDGAWEFLSLFLTEEYQDALNGTFPIRISSLEKMADKEVEEAEKQKQRYEEQQQGGGGYYPGFGEDYIVGGMIGMPNPGMQQNSRVFLDREMADEMLAFLKTLNHVRRTNTKVINIIKEESAAYFAGQKSLDETVKLIQNRAEILVAEGR